MFMSALILNFPSFFIEGENFAVSEVFHSIPTVKKLLKFGIGKVSNHLLVLVFLRPWHSLPVHVDL